MIKRVVLDTDVLVAALRSPTGASAEIVTRAMRGGVRLLASVPLFLKYEAQYTNRSICVPRDSLQIRR